MVREEGRKRVKRERELICLYYFNELYVKIETGMLDEL